MNTNDNMLKRVTVLAISNEDDENRVINDVLMKGIIPTIPIIDKKILVDMNKDAPEGLVLEKAIICLEYKSINC